MVAETWYLRLGQSKLWVSDITYLKTRESNAYLSLVTDAISRMVMGCHLSPDLRTEGVMEALKVAIKNRVNKYGLIHYSDRGLQCCSEDYQQLLRANGITTSMKDGYDCYQNALAECVNGMLKGEFITNIQRHQRSGTGNHTKYLHLQQQETPLKP